MRRCCPPSHSPVGADIEDTHRAVTHGHLDAIDTSGDDRSPIGHGEGALTGNGESHLGAVTPRRTGSRHQRGIIGACSKTDDTGDIADKATVGDHHPVVIAAEAHLDIASTDGEAGAGIEDIERVIRVGVGVANVRDGVSVGPRGKVGRLVRAVGADKEGLGIGLL